MLDAEVIDNFSLGFDEGSLGDTRVYVGGIGHTWTLGPEPRARRQLRHEPPGPAGDRARLRREPRPRRARHPGHQRDRRPRQSGLPHFDIPFGTPARPAPTRRSTTSAPPPTGCRSSARSAATRSAPPSPGSTGRHQVRTGVDVVRHELNHFQAEFGSFGGVRGGFQFGGLTTATPGYIPQVWNELAAFVLGLPDDPAEGRPAEIEMTGREWQYALLRHRPLAREQQADPEPRPALRDVPADDARGPRHRAPRPTTPTRCCWAACGNTPEDVGINVKKFYVAPRLGAIYRLDDDTVLRAGLRPHVQPAALVAADARVVPLRHLLQPDRRAVRVVPDRSRHPAGAGPGPQLRAREAAARAPSSARPTRTTWTAPPSSR